MVAGFTGTGFISFYVQFRAPPPPLNMSKTMAKHFSRVLFVGVFGLLAAVLVPSAAEAIPSFAAQTGQPCSACHVGAFGPQLKPYGRDFKLHGYVTSDRNDDDDLSERLTVMAKGSFNHTDADFPPSPGGKGYGPNDNFSLDQIAVYYGGRITKNIGAIQEISYDGANRGFFWDALDARRAFEGEFLGEDFVAGILVGNQLGNTSIWNSGTPNGFPYNSSSIAPTPQAGTLFDDSLNGKIMGTGLYGLWNDWIYAEADVYAPLSLNMQQAVGNTASDKYDGVIPYWHLAVQHDFDHHKHYFQVGTYGAVADRYPGTIKPVPTQTDHIADIGLEANYQYLADLDNVLSFHATYVHEKEDLTASSVLNGTNPSDHLNTFNTDVTYSFNDTFVPTIGYFKTTGSSDAALYTSANGNPNSEGYIIDLAYVPFGKPDSYVTNGNMRLALQYTGYTRFDGTSKHASDNNTLFLNLWFVLAPLKTSFGK